MEYKFTSEKGYCPQCIAFGKRYYIQDKYIGADEYNYALMSIPLDREEPKQFKDKKELMSYLLNSVVNDDITANLLMSQRVIRSSGSYKMLEENGMQYIWSEEHKTLRVYVEPKQETGYFENYLDCLTMAKKILLDMEYQRNGKQLSLL